MKPKYFLHVRNKDAPFSVVELAFSQKGYGIFDYRILFENSIYSFYLSSKGLGQTYRFGKKLLENNGFNLIFQKN